LRFPFFSIKITFKSPACRALQNIYKPDSVDILIIFKRRAVKGGIIKKEKMENHHFWALLAIALIASVSIGFVISSNSMTGNAVFGGTPMPTPTSDAITLLNKAVVIEAFPGFNHTSNVTTTCNDVCAYRNGTCVDAEVKEGGVSGSLRPVECSYAANSRQILYCRCVGSVVKTTAYEQYANTEMSNFVKSKGGWLNIPKNTVIVRESTDGKLTPGKITTVVNTGAFTDPRGMPLGKATDCKTTTTYEQIGEFNYGTNRHFEKGSWTTTWWGPVV